MPVVETKHKIAAYLDGYDRLIANAGFYATLDPPMEEGEQIDARMAYLQYAGQRKELGVMYRAEQLSAAESSRLAELDLALLQNASAVEVAYGLSLGKLVGPWSSFWPRRRIPG